PAGGGWRPAPGRLAAGEDRVAVVVEVEPRRPLLRALGEALALEQADPRHRLGKPLRAERADVARPEVGVLPTTAVAATADIDRVDLEVVARQQQAQLQVLPRPQRVVGLAEDVPVARVLVPPAGLQRQPVVAGARGGEPAAAVAGEGTAGRGLGEQRADAEAHVQRRLR